MAFSLLSFVLGAGTAVALPTITRVFRPHDAELRETDLEPDVPSDTEASSNDAPRRRRAERSRTRSA